MVSQGRASHILVKTETEANDVMKKLNAGKEFADLARLYSTCPSGKKGGDLGFFGKGQMVKEFESAAFSMEKGQVTQKPVKTQFGYHIIKVTDKK
jgi:peptidyl-prolyl cis-trans isomerase C